MRLLSGIDGIAWRRGDGLLPQLRDLLLQREAIASIAVDLETRRAGGVRQAGPHTTTCGTVAHDGGIIDFPSAPDENRRAAPASNRKGHA